MNKKIIFGNQFNRDSHWKKALCQLKVNLGILLYSQKKKKERPIRTRGRHNTDLKMAWESRRYKIDHQIPCYLLLGSSLDCVQSWEPLGAKLSIATMQWARKSCQLVSLATFPMRLWKWRSMLGIARSFSRRLKEKYEKW